MGDGGLATERPLIPSSLPHAWARSLSASGVNGLPRLRHQLRQLGVTPDRLDRFVTAYLPARVIDPPPAPPVLDRELRGVRHVERHHVIVHVPAEIDDDRCPHLAGDVAGGAHIVERVALEHEVIDSLWSATAEQSD